MAAAREKVVRGSSRLQGAARDASGATLEDQAPCSKRYQQPLRGVHHQREHDGVCLVSDSGRRADFVNDTYPNLYLKWGWNFLSLLIHPI